LRADLREAEEIELTEINIVIPESLTTQKTELETTLAEIARAEEKLAAQRKDIQAALTAIATAVAVLSGKPISVHKPVVSATRKPMSPEAKQRIAEGLRKAREAKTNAAQVVAPSPEVPASGGSDLSQSDTRRGPRTPRKLIGIQ
jgi:type IV secretory pathway ATPase VirB11/archaellum biosynthesis ATPase